MLGSKGDQRRYSSETANGGRRYFDNERSGPNESIVRKDRVTRRMARQRSRGRESEV